MYDQAEKLRRIIKKLKLNKSNHTSTQVNNKKKAKVITITSGKGGVGKTNITINLAIALRELGLRVIVIDADFGLSNVDILFGIVPQYTLADVINEEKNIIEVMAEEPRSKVKFISGGSGINELANLGMKERTMFLKNISLLDRLTDIILVDTGAGISENVIQFVMAADDILLVLTPEPTSITDAYALIKMIANKDKNRKIKLIINRADSLNEANDIVNKISKVAEKFLAVKVEKLGYILNDDIIKKAVKIQQPFSLIYPKSNATKSVKEISRKLVDNTNSVSENITGFKGFINRLGVFKF